jgi:hypothetical protein
MPVMSLHQKTGTAFWVVLFLFAVPFLYVAGFGPAIWFNERIDSVNERCVATAYWPLGWLAVNGPSVVSVPLTWYAVIGGPETWTNANMAIVPVNANEWAYVVR